jgi:hypothetical protein
MKYYLKNDRYITNSCVSDLIIYRSEWEGNLIIHSDKIHVELNHNNEIKLLKELSNDEICKEILKEQPDIIKNIPEENIPNVIRTLPVEIVDFINYFCDVVKNTDVCRDGEIQAEWIKYNG